MDLSKYAALFLAESREHLSACNRLLLEWEREPAVDPPGRRAVPRDPYGQGHGGHDGLRRGRRSWRTGWRTCWTRCAGGPRPRRLDEFQLLFRSVDALTAGVEGAVAGASGLPDSGLLDELDAAASVVGEAVMTTEHPAVSPRPSGVFAAAREEARPVQVALRRDAVMRGARAALVLQRAEGLGAVSAVRPAPTHFDSQDFDGRFAFRLATTGKRAGDRDFAPHAPARSSRCATRPTMPRPSPPRRADRFAWISAGSTR